MEHGHRQAETRPGVVIDHRVRAGAEGYRGSVTFGAGAEARIRSKPRPRPRLRLRPNAQAQAHTKAQALTQGALRSYPDCNRSRPKLLQIHP